MSSIQSIYRVHPGLPSGKLIHIEWELNGIQEEQLEIALPIWRPGRYELGNFAKNIMRVEAFGHENTPLPVRKISSHRWIIETGMDARCTVKYSYYAAELNAGSSFLDERQLYVNPVNCFMYQPERMHDACRVQLDIPSNWKLACALAKSDDTHVFEAKDFDTLADSPFIAGASLQHRDFTQNEHRFHIWFSGDVNPKWDKLIEDFRAFIEVQIGTMGPLPLPEYHFLFQILPYPFYHGVEHLSSTVCALGPGYQLFQPALYRELLGVSSHELFHAWNIKYIRPEEMWPYDFSRENYSRLGWVYEGITTYYGDLFLARSKVFSLEDFLLTLNEKLKKHFESYGRFNQPVAEASFDTWLDGYVAGIPHRKTSIYTEGSLVAWILDIQIRKDSHGAYSLDDLMRALLKERKLNKSYNKVMIVDMLSAFCKKDMNILYEQLVEQPTNLEEFLREVAAYLGLSLLTTETHSPCEHVFGFLLTEGSSDTVKLVAPGSPAGQAGLAAGDQIVAVNTWKNRQIISAWAEPGSQLKLHVFSGEVIREIDMQANGEKFFVSRKLAFDPHAGEIQRKAWHDWSGLEFPSGVIS